MFVAFSSVPVQLFLAFRCVLYCESQPLSIETTYRVYGLAHNKYLLGFTIVTSIIQGLAAVGTSIGCLILAEYIPFQVSETQQIRRRMQHHQIAKLDTRRSLVEPCPDRLRLNYHVVFGLDVAQE